MSRLDVDGERRRGSKIDDLEGGRYLGIPPNAAFARETECVARAIIQRPQDLTCS
jgi:hypothetical protein